MMSLHRCQVRYLERRPDTVATYYVQAQGQMWGANDSSFILSFPNDWENQLARSELKDEQSDIPKRRHQKGASVWEQSEGESSYLYMPYLNADTN